MRYKTSMFMAMLLVMAFAVIYQPIQAQPIQLSTTAKYVGTAEDTVILGGIVIRRQVLITNQSADKNLIVEFSSKLGVRLTNSYTVIPPGKSAKVWGTFQKVFRKASADSVFSQVLFGEIELRSNIQQGEPSLLSTQIVDTQTEYNSLRYKHKPNQEYIYRKINNNTIRLNGAFKFPF